MEVVAIVRGVGGGIFCCGFCWGEEWWFVLWNVCVVLGGGVGGSFRF